MTDPQPSSIHWLRPVCCFGLAWVTAANWVIVRSTSTSTITSRPRPRPMEPSQREEQQTQINHNKNIRIGQGHSGPLSPLWSTQTSTKTSKIKDQCESGPQIKSIRWQVPQYTCMQRCRARIACPIMVWESGGVSAQICHC